MSKEEDFKWVEELSGEMEDYNFSYPVGQDPETIKTLVTAAVYQTLSGQEVSLREQRRFIADSSSIKDEETEVAARGLMDKVRYILSESNGYQYEWDEAKTQGQRAAEAIREDRDFSTYYDYWQMRPVKDGVRLYKLEDFPDHSILSCALPELGDLMGLPYNLLSRDVTLESQRRGQASDSPVDFFKKVASGLGKTPEEVLQEMYQGEQKMAFVQAMNDAGHTNFDRARSAIVYSGDKGYKVYSVEEQYAMLSKKEKEITQRPRTERLHGGLRHELSFGANRATLTFDLWTEGIAWFDPSKMAMTGEVIPRQHDALYTRLRPSVTPNSDHNDFLQIRRQAQGLVKNLGFPDRPKRWF